MDNTITEKYFTQEDFSARADEVCAQVCADTGFVIEKEIFRGYIYEKTKVGSLIYLGTYRGQPAVLKLQGLKPEIDEGEILSRFAAQNKSAVVRVPKLYVHEPWTEELGYGYLITEYIDAPLLFTLPFASEAEMHDFARFYQEYRTAALTKPWAKAEEQNSAAFCRKRVEHWQKIATAKGRLAKDDIDEIASRFLAIADKELGKVPMVFCHGHLTANDIFRMPNGQFVVLSNLFWSYRPQWYVLAFNVWACLTHIRDTAYTFEAMTEYTDRWLAVYRTVPVVNTDPAFERTIRLMLLERAAGTLLVDLGAADAFDLQENKKFFDHLWSLQRRWFDHLLAELGEMPTHPSNRSATS